MFKTIRKWLQSEQRFVNLSTDPRAARHWHNPADPVQAARIEAAAAKRERKARILGENADRAFMNNPAHTDGLRLPARFNPFHVAH